MKWNVSNWAPNISITKPHGPAINLTIIMGTFLLQNELLLNDIEPNHPLSLFISMLGSPESI